MTSEEKTKFVHEYETSNKSLKARRPFRVEEENHRHFVRIEISAPMTMHRIRNAGGEFWPEGEWHTVNGTILNISAGGVLVDIDQRIGEGDIVALHFILQDVEALNDILGIVKRVEEDDEGLLAGIEFVSRSQIEDRLSQAELDLLPASLSGFEDTIRKVLDNYVYEDQQV
jgi:hypothetical protein